MDTSTSRSMSRATQYCLPIVSNPQPTIAIDLSTSSNVQVSVNPPIESSKPTTRIEVDRHLAIATE